MCLVKQPMHNLGAKNEWPTFKRLQSPILDFCLIYIIIIVVGCWMSIDEMMSC